MNRIEVAIKSDKKDWLNFTTEVRSHLSKALFFSESHNGDTRILNIQDRHSKNIGQVIWKKETPETKTLCYYAH